MKARQLYAYLYGDIAEEQGAEVENIFAEMKAQWGSYRIRPILRAAKAAKLEEIAYKSSNEELTMDLLYEANDGDKKFTELNDQYGYFEARPEKIECFKQVYLASKLHNLDEDDVHEDPQFEYAYKLMVYFGFDSAPENILNYFDLYSSQLDSNYLIYAKLLGLPLRQSQSLIHLEAWQSIIIKENSLDAIALLNLAQEIEIYLGHAPENYLQAKESADLLVSEKEWSKEELNHILSFSSSESWLNNFILTISSDNLNRLISTGHDCSLILALLSADMQGILLQRLGADLITRIYKSDKGYSSYNKLFRQVDPSIITYLIRDILGVENVLLSDMPFEINFSSMMSAHFPLNYNKAEFISLLSEEQLQRNVKSISILADCLQYIHDDEKAIFMLDKIGEEHLRSLTQSTRDLATIIDKLALNERMPFIRRFCSGDILERMRHEKNDYEDIKTMLPVSGKLALKALIYSPEELAEKKCLKNIKTTIMNTKWHFSLFDAPVNVQLGKRGGTFDVPQSVVGQVQAFWSIKTGTKTQAQALEDIKTKGRETFRNNKTRMNSAYHKFLGKNETELYFEKFKDDQVFKKSFSNMN